MISEKINKNSNPKLLTNQERFRIFANTNSWD